MRQGGRTFDENIPGSVVFWKGVEETAEVLKISRETVRGDWNGRSVAGRQVRVELVGRKEPVMATLETGATVVRL